MCLHVLGSHFRSVTACSVMFFFVTLSSCSSWPGVEFQGAILWLHFSGVELGSSTGGWRVLPQFQLLPWVVLGVFWCGSACFGVSATRQPPVQSGWKTPRSGTTSDRDWASSAKHQLLVLHHCHFLGRARGGNDVSYGNNTWDWLVCIFFNPMEEISLVDYRLPYIYAMFTSTTAYRGTSHIQ